MSAPNQGRLHVSFQPSDGARRALDTLPGPVTCAADPSGQDRSELLSDVRGAAALVCLLTDRVDAELLDAAGPSLRVVANMAVGYDNVDVAACAARGITVTNTPGVLDEATADLAFALLLATSRRVVEADAFVRSGEPWSWRPDLFVGLDVSSGATLGIVGLPAPSTCASSRPRPAPPAMRRRVWASRPCRWLTFWSPRTSCRCTAR